MDLLVCPRCKGRLSFRSDELLCAQCRFKGQIQDDVVAMVPICNVSYFDDKYNIVAETHKRNSREWKFCYEQQVHLLQWHMKPGMIVLDVGCGAFLPYLKNAKCSIVGLEASFQSIRANKDVDLRIFGTAASIPFPDHSFDMVVCLYTLHHIVGSTFNETRALVKETLSELARVIKPGGFLFVFEMIPISLVSIFQNLFWNGFKRLLGSKLEMYFWSSKHLENLGEEVMGGPY